MFCMWGYTNIVRAWAQVFFAFCELDTVYDSLIEFELLDLTELVWALALSGYR